MISALDKQENTLTWDNRSQDNAQCAPDIASHWLVKLGALSFMSPYLVFVLSGGNTKLYRILQFAWLILALLSILRFRKTRSPPSLTFLTLLAILVFGSVVSIINIATGLDQTTQVLQKIVALILILLYFDGFRFLGLNFYFERFKLSAALIILASIVHFLQDPSAVNGRYLFFGVHPNLGGEILFASVICIALLRSKVAFLLLTILALVGMYYLQSRAALLGTIFFLVHAAAQAGQDSVTIWGSGIPRREFLHVDDMAEASLFALDLPKDVYASNTAPMLSHINVGTGEDISIVELAQMVGQMTGFDGRIVTDPSKPDGTIRKLLDVSRLAQLGWRARIGLREGVAQTYRWYIDNAESARG